MYRIVRVIIPACATPGCEMNEREISKSKQLVSHNALLQKLPPPRRLCLGLPNHVKIAATEK